MIVNTAQREVFLTASGREGWNRQNEDYHRTVISL
jgi:hypothetical protein